MRPILVALFVTFVSSMAIGQAGVTRPRVLIVDAHPDDETAYAATVYKITHQLGGTVDLVVVTNGEAGYKYSTAAEGFYGLKLTEEKVGRKYLPAIRKKELTSAGKIIGIRKIFFLNQLDNHYTQNQHEVLDDTSHVWNLGFVRTRLQSIIASGKYDYIFTLLPTDSTHGHHKGATILALEAVRNLPAQVKHPIILAGNPIKKGAAPVHFVELAGYPLTHISDGVPQFTFDRTQPFGFRKALNYNVFVNWEIAEHKSQGTMQLGVNGADLEQFWYYDINPPEGRAQVQSLFERLAQNDFPDVTYPGIK